MECAIQGTGALRATVLTCAAILQETALRLKYQLAMIPTQTRQTAFLLKQFGGIMGSDSPNNGISRFQAMCQLTAECFILSGCLRTIFPPRLGRDKLDRVVVEKPNRFTKSNGSALRRLCEPFGFCVQPDWSLRVISAIQTALLIEESVFHKKRTSRDQTLGTCCVWISVWVECGYRGCQVTEGHRLRAGGSRLFLFLFLWKKRTLISK